MVDCRKGSKPLYILLVALFSACSDSATEHHVVATAGSGGTITPLVQTVEDGDTAVFTVTPNAGYAISAVTGCGGALVGNEYTTGPITVDCAVSATFSQTGTSTMVTVTATAGVGGSITPMTQMVAINSTASLTVSAATGYTIGSVTGCNGTLSGSVYTTGKLTANCTVAATFTPTGASVTVTATAGTGGTVMPATQSIPINGTAVVTVMAEPGYGVATVTGCGGSLTDATYRTAMLTGNCTVSATFVRTGFAVVATAGDGGTIAPASQIVTSGQTATLTVTASAGHHIAVVTGCGGTLNGSTYTTGAITADCAVSATFASDGTTFTVTASAGPGGTAAPATQSAAPNSTVTVSVTPNEGYGIDSVTGCGGTLAGSTYTTGPITADCAINATFSRRYTVMAAASVGGAIMPATQQVSANATATLTVVPDSGFVIGTVMGCGGTLNGATYTTAPITADCAVAATFVSTGFTVSATAGAGGSIDPEVQSVGANMTAVLTVTPDSGFAIETVTGCGGVLEGTTYTTAPIIASCTVSAVFTAHPIVSAVAGTGGNLTPLTQTVDVNTTATLTVTAFEGYGLSSITGCNGTLSENVYTTAPVLANCTVSALFHKLPLVTASAGPGGTIAPLSQYIEPDTSATLTLAPSPHHRIGTVSGCGGTLQGNTYTTANLVSDCHVTATFVRQYLVTTVTNGNGSIAPTSQTVDAQSNATFTVTPEENHAVAEISGCNGTLNGSIYTTGPVAFDCTVTVTFLPNYLVTTFSGDGVELSPESQLVTSNSSAVISVSVNSTHVLDEISGCGEGTFNGTAYITAPVTGDCAVNATASLQQLVYAGGFHSCAVLNTGDVRCWGQNSSGQLGVSTFSLTAHGDEAGEAPGDNAIVDVPNGLQIRRLSLGAQHSCAVLSDYNLYCWGENQNGQLGIGPIGDTKMITDPVDFNGTAVLNVAASGQHTCALLANGEVWCFGLGTSGELGTNSAMSQNVPTIPVDFNGVRVTKLTAGSSHNCALTELGQVYCWGDNSSGQLGDNDGGNDSALPSLVTISGEVTDLAAGNLHTCATVNGDVVCWGENGSGQLGNNDGTNTDLDVPSAILDINGETPSQLSLGGEHSCVLTTLGNVYCWGESDAGQTGQNDTTDDIAPALVFLGSDYTVLQIDAGGDHTCVVLKPTNVLDTSRPVRCWGEGGVGQLGLEDTSDIGDNEVVDNDAFNVQLYP